MVKSNGRKVWKQVKVVQIPITIKADLFLGIFEAIPGTLQNVETLLEPLRNGQILFENPLWTSGEFGGFCIDSYYVLKEGDKCGKLIFEHSSAKQKFESPGFQIEYQTNWKVNASSHGIQSKIHWKSKC